MKIGVLGTGMVGETIASKLVQRGHEVKMGSRDAKNPKAVAWMKKAGAKASAGTFQDAAKFGELLFNCTLGSASIDALNSADKKDLEGKVLVDISNALDLSKGVPTLFVDVANESLGERIQKAFPKAKVVKTLNTVTANLMGNPGALPGDHNLFLSGNDLAARQQVAQILEQDFGWKPPNIIDLGDLTTARGPEAMILAWIRLYGKFGTPMFNWHVVRAKD